ncbi:MAG: hypothetical protein H6R01_1747 [Burkholderiaceae bacterium]|nr:hypothetical protein [Burkholderiaceae bacterium]
MNKALIMREFTRIGKFSADFLCIARRWPRILSDQAMPPAIETIFEYQKQAGRADAGLQSLRRQAKITDQNATFGH